MFPIRDGIGKLHLFLGRDRCRFVGLHVNEPLAKLTPGRMCAWPRWSRQLSALESNASPLFRERPGWFMEMLPHFVRNDRVIVFGKPSLRWHFASVQGFARMVAEADDSFS